MTLHGRARELAELDGAVRDARSRRAIVLTIGEAGIGKTALLDELRRRMSAEQILVLPGRAAEHERDVPFALVADALADHVASMHPRRIEAVDGDVPAILVGRRDTMQPGNHGPAERLRYHRALVSLLEMIGRERRFALVLDDLHSADDASAEFVLHLLRRPPAVAHLLALASRPSPLSTQLLEALRRGSGGRIVELEPLSPDASLALLSPVSDEGRRRRISQRAAGNPLFLVELARVAQDPDGPLPPSIVAAVTHDLELLPAAARQVAAAAAVAGDPFDHELVAHIAKVPPETVLAAIDDLVAAGVVSSTADGRLFAFRHPLVHRAIYDHAPPGWRLEAHARAAGALRARGAGPLEAAFHVARSATVGDVAAAELLAQAGALSVDASPPAAAHWYGEALRLAADADPGRRVEWLVPRARALASAGHYAAARQALLDALAILPEAAAAARAELTVACASLDTLSGDHPGARARLLAAYAGAPADLRGDLAAALAGQAFLANDRVELRRWIARVLDQDRDVRGATAVSAHALLAMAALWEGDHAASSEALDRACAAFDACDDATLGRHGEMAGQLGLSLFAHERYVETAAAMARAIAAAQTSRHGSALPWLRVVRALSLFLLLDLDEAMREVDSAYEGARLGTADNVFQFALWIRAMVHLERGELDHAERAAAECASILERLADSQLVHTARCAIALVRCGKDPAEGVRDAIAAAGADLEALGPSRRAVILAQLVRPAIVSGNLAAAECWAAWLTEQAGTRGLSVGAARASTARSEVLLARGDARAAVEAAREAVGWSQDASSAYDALLARLAAGRALGAAGDRAGAVAELQRAGADAARGHAFRRRDEAARELRLVGARLSAEATRAAGRASFDALSDREHEIALLVAAGNTNKQIALALHLSAKTVEHHLTRIYAKAGVQTRLELARRMHAEQP